MNATQRRIVIFFLVTYALSWFGWLGNWLAPSEYWPLPMNPLGPIVAAPLVIWLTEGRDALMAWLRRIARFRAPLWIYLVALVVPVVVIVASIGLAAATGAPMQALEPREPVEFLILIPVMFLTGPVEEELSFRGYGQHDLQTVMPALNAAIWIGIGVVIWHAPLFLIGNVPWPFVVTLVAVSVVYAWLYRMGGSLWPLVVLHFSVNYFGGEWLGAAIAPAGQTLYAVYFAAFYLLWAAVIVWQFGPGLGGQRQTA